MDGPSILVIIGSVRRQRIGPQIAAWVADVGRSHCDAAFELVDLHDWPLPMDDEPGIPAQGGYVQEHTKAWSEKIAAAQGFVFVTPQYNWGYPAALKNALDHLYREWSGKPAMIVAYGGHGGDKCADQLRQILVALKMKVTPTTPGLILPRTTIAANRGEIDPPHAFAEQVNDLRHAFGEFVALLAQDR